MRVSPTALALCISGTVAFAPGLSRNHAKPPRTITTCQAAPRRRELEFPTPQVTSTTRIPTDSTHHKSIMEARHSLLEMQTCAEQAKEYLEYLENVADVVTCFLQDESTPLHRNLPLPELENVQQATDYLVNIQLATTSATEYLQYLEHMSRDMKGYLEKLQHEYSSSTKNTDKESKNKDEETRQAQVHLENLQETAEAARDYLKYLQTVSSVVQTHLVDPNLHHKISVQGIPELQDFMPQHLSKTASSEERRTHSKPHATSNIPPPARSLQVDVINRPKVVPQPTETKTVGAYLTTLQPSSSSTALMAAVTENNMDYLDTVTSSLKDSGVATEGGTISDYLDSINPEQQRSNKRRFLNMHDLQSINQTSGGASSKSTTRRHGDYENEDYDRAKAAAAGMMDIPPSAPPGDASRRRPSLPTPTAEEAYRAGNDNERDANNMHGGGDNTAAQPQRPNPWSTSQASKTTAAESPPISSSSLIGEAQMPADWMAPKGPMADLFGGGSSVPQQQQPPPSTPNEIQRPTNENDSTGTWTAPPNVPRKPRDLLNEVQQLDAHSIKEKNSPTLGRPPQGQTQNQRPTNPASGYNSNVVNDGSSAVAFSDWMQPKGPMAGGGSTSSSAPTANNDWMGPKGPVTGGVPASSMPPPQVSRQPRDLQNEAQLLNSLSKEEQTDPSQPPPVPPEEYLDQMAAPNETIDWSNYNAGSPAIASPVTSSTSSDPYHDEMPIETVDWSYLDPGKRSPAAAAAVSAKKQPVSSLDEMMEPPSYTDGENPWVVPLKDQAALSSNSYQEQPTSPARRRATTTLPPVPSSIRSFFDQVKLSIQRGRQIDWSRTRDTKRIRIAPPRPEESEYYPNPLPQTSQPVDWTSVAEATTIPEPGTGGFLQSKPYDTRETGGQLADPKYFFLEEPVEDFFFTKLKGPERKAGEPISPKLPILGAKYMDQLEQVARQNPLNLREELEKRRVLEDDELLEEPGYFERIFEAGEMINGRLAMFFLLVGLAIEYTTGATLPTQAGSMGEEWNGFFGRSSGSPQSENIVQNPPGAKVEKSVHDAGSSKVQQSVQATMTDPTPPPPPVTRKEVRDSSKIVDDNDQAVAESPKADAKVQNDVVKTSNVEPPVRDTVPPPPLPVPIQSSGETNESPKQDVPNSVATEKVEPQVSVPSAPSIVAEPPRTETVKQQAQLEETAPSEIKQPIQNSLPSPAPAPVVEKTPPVADPKSSTTTVEKDEEADVSDKPSFPNLENWSF